ncbi:MAG: hypothetical protein A3E85_02465 [Gammaproteobacteria bacterium RIFCSPHIGHO2_12_FULL_45_12]|nr:MAG: hypothetical protein A3E85_02465 [Gammaproteobacteria bacterium RIFCSPHIGHO2_12_FULL_45_12]
MKIMKKMSIMAGALLLVAGVGVSQAADTSMSSIKVAVVNVQKVLQESPRVTELSKKLEGQFKARQTSIGNEQKSLEAALEAFKKEAPTMSQKDRDATQKKLSDDRATLVKKVVAYQQDLQKEQGKIMQGIMGDLNSIVSKMAKSQSFSLVLDSQAVVFAADESDLTKDVAKQFNAGS